MTPAMRSQFSVSAAAEALRYMVLAATERQYPPLKSGSAPRYRGAANIYFPRRMP